MSASKFRKKPVVIEAEQLAADNVSALAEWCGGQPGGVYDPDNTEGGSRSQVFIPTLEGEMRAEIGDWVIKGVAGEFYPCKPEIFAATYEAVEG